jgi:hypothetical protein
VKRSPPAGRFASGRDIECADDNAMSVMNNNHRPPTDLAERPGKSHSATFSLSARLKDL